MRTERTMTTRSLWPMLIVTILITLVMSFVSISLLSDTAAEAAATAETDVAAKPTTAAAEAATSTENP